jgi:hypothetical protein
MSETVALKGALGHSAVLGYAEDSKYDEDYDEAALEQFLADYELLNPQPMRYWLGNPEEDFYQGYSFTTVYRRKADGKLFGYTYWHGGGKYGEAFYEANGEEFGLDADTYVFEEVEPFTVTGYKIKGNNA